MIDYMWEINVFPSSWERNTNKSFESLQKHKKIYNTKVKSKTLLKQQLWKNAFVKY